MSSMRRFMTSRRGNQSYQQMTDNNDGDMNTRPWTPGKIALGLSIGVLVLAVALGGYHLSRYIIFLFQHYLHLEWFSTTNPVAWIVAVILLLLVFGALRYVTTFVSKLFRFVFRFAQSDVVTIVIAVGVNIIFLVLDYWLTSQTLHLMTLTQVPTWFIASNWISVATLFIMYAGALVWIPRTGVYGENSIASAIDDGNRW
jgi:hypothetical protein